MYLLTYFVQQDVKNEAEAYMLKELSLLKWQEKAAKMAHEDTNKKMVELQANVSSLEENLKTERYMLMTSTELAYSYLKQKNYIWWRFWHHILGRRYKKVIKHWRSLKLCITSTWRDKRLAEHWSDLIFSIEKCLYELINIIVIRLSQWEENILV